jgi:hypothetical protein
VDFFAGCSPRDLVRSLPLGKMRRQRMFLSFEEQLIEGNLKRPRKLFEGLDRRVRVPVFHARDVGGSKPCAFVDITLRKLLRFAKGSYAAADEHRVSIPQESRNGPVQENKSA